MGEILVTARLEIHPGKADEFKKVAEACMVSVKEKDTGTLQYSWFFSSDQNVCIVQEAYKDSDSVLAHVGNLGSLLGQLLEISNIDLSIYGDASEELIKATEGLGTKYYSFFQGL